jgi:Polyketide cyclase / dehydrase and lipid transport
MSVGDGWRAGIYCMVVLGAIAVGRAQTAPLKPINEALTFNRDGAQRSKDIHWPKGFHPEQADLFAHNEIVVHASCEKVFANMADAQAWPSWYPNSQNVKLLNSPDGKLHEGTRFSWDTFGLHFESRVYGFVPNSRIGWFGDSSTTNGYHTYHLSKTNEGCHVVTEEVVKGPGAVELRKNRPEAMHEGHDLWLSNLKQRSEN